MSGYAGALREDIATRGFIPDQFQPTASAGDLSAGFNTDSGLSPLMRDMEARDIGNGVTQALNGAEALSVSAGVAPVAAFDDARHQTGAEERRRKNNDAAWDAAQTSAEILNDHLAALDQKLAEAQERYDALSDVLDGLESGELSMQEAMRREHVQDAIKAWEQRQGRRFDASAPGADVLFHQIISEGRDLAQNDIERFTEQRREAAALAGELDDLPEAEARARVEEMVETHSLSDVTRVGNDLDADEARVLDEAAGANADLFAAFREDQGAIPSFAAEADPIFSDTAVQFNAAATETPDTPVPDFALDNTIDFG